MGFLDNSTNNIIIDAVLTDAGRRKLADNNGSFRIAYFSLGDDEVDYTIIEKFGRTVGKEKITKNTPIFEAQTKGDLALKNRLITLPNPTVVRMPSISLDGTTGLNNNTISFTRGRVTSVDVTAKQQTTDGSAIPEGANDITFTVSIPSRFVQITGQTPLSVSPNTRVAAYSITATNQSNGATGAQVTFKLALVPGLTDTDFTTYGDGSTIVSVVSVVGDQTGTRKEFQISITK